jgi:hypothetical protein
MELVTVNLGFAPTGIRSSSTFQANWVGNVGTIKRALRASTGLDLS